MIGQVLLRALLDTRSDGVLDPRHKQTLQRVKLWDKAMNRPDDRVAAIRMGVLARGLAMHKALDPICVFDAEAVARYALFDFKPNGDKITPDIVRHTLLRWPKEWRRFAGVAGAVPLDALTIGLVALGFDPPATLPDIRTMVHGFHVSSGGRVTSWPNVEVPDGSSPMLEAP